MCAERDWEHIERYRLFRDAIYKYDTGKTEYRDSVLAIPIASMICLSYSSEHCSCGGLDDVSGILYH